jgi:transposase InsO family protein
MDLYSRKIVGWAMADHLRVELPLAALAMAIAAQRPSLVSVAKRIEALQIACFLAFFRTIFLVIYVCVLSHV